MGEYKSNSYRSKELPKEPLKERPKVEKVVEGRVRSKKKGYLHKCAEVFISEDVSSVKSYLIMDVLIPNIKKAISDGVDMILYGDTGRGKRMSTSKTPYHRAYYEKSNDTPRSPRLRSGYDFDDIILDTRGDAERVLSQLDDIIDTYGIASVADMYDLVGKSGNYTDCKYGWTDLRMASVVRTGDGYMLKLPKALPLD